ncbi:hypothetical protein H1W83_02295 [Priestia megaterium]|uniref:hypothetical protein n=1 Tax=Priestia megaterium TaxID=1404 RepID=UPI001EDA3733|nr:hypothetical protein [Priestia megaterium]UKJ81196.1 hypothetical protein H1W83_02295 [Priestia megaterium]
MAKKSAVKQMEELFKKVEEVKEKFEVASQKALEEAEVLKQEIQEEEKEVQELYTMYVLDQIVLEAYQEAKDKLDNKKKLLTVAEGKSADMEGLKKKELYKLYQQVREIEDDYRKEDNRNIAVHRKRIFQAKVDYLKFMHEAQKEMTATYKFNRKIGDLKVDLGLLAYNHTNGIKTANRFFEDTYSRTPGIDVTREEVTQAFNRGTYSTMMLEAIK